MEQFDILNIKGEPIGLVADKGTLLENGQYYLGVHAYIYNTKNDFLLQRRALDKVFLPGGWDIHMGHVVAGETSKNGIVREIREEIGLSLFTNDVRLVGRVIWEIHHHMIDIYFLQADFKINELSFQKEEVIGLKSINAIDMMDLVSNMNYRPEEYRQIVLDEIKNLITAV